MKGSLLKAELKSIFGNKKVLIPIMAILFIPILYAGMFLWAFWDPYGHLDQLPVAIVNDDKGADFEGEELQLGNDLVENLKESADFSFHFLEKDKAYEDLKNEQYYLLVEIPQNFSENATTLLKDHPEKLDLKYVTNEGYNFLSGKIGDSAIEKIKSSLSEKITETYAEKMFDKMTEVADGLGEASDGAAELDAAAKDLKTGSGELHKNLVTLAEKSIAFNNGVGEINSGSKEIANGAGNLASGMQQLEEGHKQLEGAAGQLAAGQSDLASGIQQTEEGIHAVDEKLPALTGGTEELESGAKTLSSSLVQWESSAEKVSNGIKDLKANLQAMISQLPEDSPERVALESSLESLIAGTTQLADSASDLSAGATELAAGLTGLHEGQTGLQQGIQKLAEGASALKSGSDSLVQGHSDFQAGMEQFAAKFTEAKTGAAELAKGAGVLSGGVGELTNGSASFADGTKKLSDGSTKLANGNAKMSDGSGQLADSLAKGADQASSVHATDQTVNMMASPVELDSDGISDVPNYGTGLTPYFLSLGLFVGALLLTIVFPVKEPAAEPKNAFSWFIGKFGVIAGVGVIQALIASFVMLAGLNLEVQNVGLFILFAIITSLTYIAIIQFLVTSLGDPGRFIAIIILILQLTTSAGTFPLELIPDVLQPIHALLPMTYSVAGFRAVISSGDFSSMWHNASFLAGYMIVFIMGSMLYFQLLYKRLHGGSESLTH
ncbi:YhgE/Pip domain-containing protein [Cytobacillus gottheilii]|uniref:YhgE/Pip domain-containing protein n=1 Tax=Cytobacillus gottheilii TaxID=859144 RepID=UPI0008359AE6|nr:YhgE/Pip domain-containing protein [Cytobacillus gottheilii]